MSEIAILKARILQYLDFKGISKYECYQKTGITNGVLSKKEGLSEDNLLRFISYYSDISPVWMLTGKGDMIENASKNIYQTKSTENATKLNGGVNGGTIGGERKVQKMPPNYRTSFPKTPASIKDEDGNESILITQRFPLRTDHPVELQRIPLYDFDATAGMVGLFSENNVQYPIDYLSIPDLPHVDGAIFVRGDSMYPLLKSGDIVVYKAINSLSNIMWGEMYIVDCDLDGDDYTAVKFLNKVDGDDSQALLVSHNSHHAPKAIPLSAIRALAIVKASIRYNVMG